MSTREELPKYVADYIPLCGPSRLQIVQMGTLSVIAMASTFTDCSFRCKSSTSDSAQLLTLLIHLHSSKTRFPPNLDETKPEEQTTPLWEKAQETRKA
jgi:hypothetical protein